MGAEPLSQYRVHHVDDDDMVQHANRANFVILEVRDFACFCGSKYARSMKKLHSIFVLGLYGALYTQNHENGVIF